MKGILFFGGISHDLNREMVDPAIYTNNDMIIVPARCQAIHLPSRNLKKKQADVWPDT